METACARRAVERIARVVKSFILVVGRRLASWNEVGLKA